MWQPEAALLTRYEDVSAWNLSDVVLSWFGGGGEWSLETVLDGPEVPFSARCCFDSMATYAKMATGTQSHTHTPPSHAHAHPHSRTHTKTPTQTHHRIEYKMHHDINHNGTLL